MKIEKIDEMYFLIILLYQLYVHKFSEIDTTHGTNLKIQ